jgi:PBSX family phage terminase large subunit
VCGRKFGKTELAIEEILGKVLFKGNKEIAYLATNYGEARDIAWQRMIKRYKPIFVQEPNETRLEMKVLAKDGTNSQIQLKGWESVENLRGREFDFIVLDETQNYKDFWLYWQEVLRPTLTPRKGSALFLGTPKGFTHLYDLFNFESRDKDYKSFHFTTYDNPYIPVEEIEKAKQELTEDRFAQEYMADFRKTEGLVYKEFNRKEHIYKEEIKEVSKTFGGVDFGFVHPAAAIEIKKNHHGIYYVPSEWYKSGQTDAQIADYVSALKWNECYPDPESAGGIEELKRRGVNVREVIKGKDSIRNGINTIRELFKQRRLFIHESCQNLIWELETYVYEDPKNRKGDEIPVKENDHALDALRYALMMETARSQPDNLIRIQEQQFMRNINRARLNETK